MLKKLIHNFNCLTNFFPVNSKLNSGTMNSTSTATTKSTSSTSRKINETSDLSLSEQSSFTTSPQTERKNTESKPSSHNVGNSQNYYRNSSSTKSGTLSSDYSTNPSSQNSSVGFVWKPNSTRHVDVNSPSDSQSSTGSHPSSGINDHANGNSSKVTKPLHLNENFDKQQNQTKNEPQDQAHKLSKQSSHVNQLVQNFNKMFPQASTEKRDIKNQSSGPSSKSGPIPHSSDNSLKDRSGSPTPQRTLSNGLSDSWGSSMQRSHSRFNEDDDTYYDTKYGKFGSLGRKESMGRYRKYQPTKSSSGAITFGSPRLVQRSTALKLASDPNPNNPSDNLFTDTGSPKYVNTSAILGQQPQKHMPSYHQYNKDLHNQNQVTRSPVVGRRGLQQQSSQRDNCVKQISKNLNNDFSKYGFDAERNQRLHPVTTIQQVLYNNGSPSGNQSAPQMNQIPNGYDQGPSPVQQPQPLPLMNNMDHGMTRPEFHSSGQKFPSSGGMLIGNNPAVNHNSSSSSTTSSNFIPPLQKSIENSHVQQSQSSGGDRVILERNLEKLITQKGLEVLGQLTAEMTHDQIERLLHKTKEKLASNSTNQPNGSPSDFGNFEQSGPSRSRRPLDIDFTRNHDLDGYLSQQLQVAPVPTNGMGNIPNSHQRYGSQTSCPSWAHEGDSFNSTPSGSKTKSPDLSNLKFMPHQDMNGRRGDESSSNEEDDNCRNGMKPKKGNLVNGYNAYEGNHHHMGKRHHSKHRHDRLNASFSGEVMGAKNLSVRFDPEQDPNMGNPAMHRPNYPDYPSSPYTEQKSRHFSPQGYPHSHHQRSHSTSHHHHHHRHHREQKPFHQRSSSSSRQPQATSTQHLQHYKEDYPDGHHGQSNYNHQPISRSHSYSSGQAGFANSNDQQRGNGYHNHQHQSSSHMMPSAMRGQTPNSKRKHGRNVAFYDDEDGRCPTCSSDSSSDSDDDPYAYQPAPRKAYGGVRLAYVPNDRRRAKLMSDPRLEYVPRNLHGSNKPPISHAVRAGSLQPQSLPAHNAKQHSQRQFQQQQQNGGMFQQQPNNVQQNPHRQQQHPLQTHQQAPYFPSQPGHHRNTQNASPAQGGDPKDKDKNCVIQ